MPELGGQFHIHRPHPDWTKSTRLSSATICIISIIYIFVLFGFMKRKFVVLSFERNNYYTYFFYTRNEISILVLIKFYI